MTLINTANTAVKLPAAMTPNVDYFCVYFAKNDKGEPFVQLVAHLPAQTQGYPWRLVYSTAVHGTSLMTLYRNMANIDRPVLLVIKDMQNQVFGAFSSHPFQVSRGCYGTGETFLYSFSPEFKVRRILVHLSRDKGVPQCARFVQSITGHFARNSLDDDQVKVNCTLENNRFVLNDTENGSLTHLRRAQFCPFKHLTETEAASLPDDILNRGVDVGVAILLQSANQRLLLTRRAASLRIFPSVWVPPGGHVELDETLLDAGLRELREETGLELDPNDVSSQLLGLWESVYPPMLSRGLPKRHHIVTYMLLHSSLSDLQLQACLKPEPAEVSGCLWVDASLVKAIVSAVDGDEDPLHLPLNTPQSVSVMEVSSTGELSKSSMPVSVLCNRAPAHGEDVERVSTGTKYALELWLKTLES